MNHLKSQPKNQEKKVVFGNRCWPGFCRLKSSGIDIKKNLGELTSEVVSKAGQ